MDHWDIQIQAEEFNSEPISALLYNIGGQHPNVLKQPTLIYQVTLQELSMIEA